MSNVNDIVKKENMFPTDLTEEEKKQGFAHVVSRLPVIDHETTGGHLATILVVLPLDSGVRLVKIMGGYTLQVYGIDPISGVDPRFAGVTQSTPSWKTVWTGVCASRNAALMRYDKGDRDLDITPTASPTERAPTKAELR